MHVCMYNAVICKHRIPSLPSIFGMSILWTAAFKSTRNVKVCYSYLFLFINSTHATFKVFMNLLKPNIMGKAK